MTIPSERVLDPRAFGALSEEDIAAGKARIVQVGTFGDNGFPTGWHFDGEGRDVVGIQLGEPYKICGWTIEELRQIAARS